MYVPKNTAVPICVLSSCFLRCFEGQICVKVYCPNSFEIIIPGVFIVYKSRFVFIVICEI